MHSINKGLKVYLIVLDRYEHTIGTFFSEYKEFEFLEEFIVTKFKVIFEFIEADEEHRFMGFEVLREGFNGNLDWALL